MHMDTTCMQAVDKVHRVMDSGSHYEAQQMVKTIYHRHKARRQLEESYAVLEVGMRVWRLG